MVNNNKNKFPAFGKHMNNTTHKTEERSFQEERRDVMKMDKLFAGLIAFVAGVALSAGSAFAQINGYMGGDVSRIKLVPYYETGDTKATIIGIQNMSTKEQSTIDLNADVKDIQDVLAGKGATQNAVDLITGFTTLGESLCADTATACEPGDPRDPTKKANAEAALEKAMMNNQVEHLFITVNAYNAEGMMMGSAELCLAENQFGAAVLQGSSAMMMDDYRTVRLSVMDEEIASYGWAKVIADTEKYSSCDPGTRAAPRTKILTAGHATEVTTDDETMSTRTRTAAWTIIQDVGMGFFGTEVPTSTVSLAKNTSADAMLEMACYTTPDAAGADANTAPFTGGAFMTSRCGLIPERAAMAALDSADATVNGVAYARYDAGDDSMVVVWLAAGEDTDTTHPSMSRTIDVDIMCEDGMMVNMMEDQYGDMKPITIAAPEKLTMIDPNGDELGAHVAMCEGDRGVLAITMPNGSRAGTVFSHITQMMGHYRMNFPGYGMAAATACDTTTTDTCL